MFLLLVLVANFTWEMVQAPLYASMRDMPFWVGTWRCFQAAIGDVLITLFAFVGAAAAARRLDWPCSERQRLPFLIFLALGMIVTIVLERWSLANGRWSYDARMPLVTGIGLAPIAQWVVLPILEISALRYVPASRTLFRG